MKKGEFPCEKCPKVFEVKRNLTKHFQRIHLKPKDPAENLRCKFCRKAFDRLSHLQRHNLTHLNVREWACPFCEDAFNQKVHLVKHLQRKHADQADADIQKTIKRNQWRESGEQPSTSRVADGYGMPLVVHQLPRKSTACAECGRLFFDESSLKRHIESAHRRLVCPCCSGVFRGIKNLKRHQMKTRGEIHRCHKCKARFARATELNTHRNSCLGMHSFLCVPCGETFAQRVQLDRHWYRSHFVSLCKHCGEEKGSPIEMKKHYHTVHSLSLCGYCGIEEDSKAHTSESHWRRMKTPMKVESTNKGHISLDSRATVALTSITKNSFNEDSTNDDFEHNTEFTEPSCSSKVLISSRVSHAWVPSSARLESTNRKDVMHILVPIPAGSTFVQISERVPIEMKCKYAELRELESITVQSSTFDRDILLFIDVQGPIPEEHGRLIKLSKPTPS